MCIRDRYYGVGIALACAFKDNRAFCKYICPITVFLKPASYFSLSRVKNDTEKCVSCGKCKTVCPMDVDMTDNARRRKNGTECILCLKCVEACPKPVSYTHLADGSGMHSSGKPDRADGPAAFASAHRVYI